MRLFFDTEFHDNGSTIELISIGIVREDGKEYHAVILDADWDRISGDSWLADNVLPHLPLPTSGLWRTKDDVANDIIAFAGTRPEWWGSCCAYDWVVLVQLVWGTMRSMDPLRDWPWAPCDVFAYKKFLNANVHFNTENPTPHEALSDAREIKQKWDILRQIENHRKSR